MPLSQTNSVQAILDWLNKEHSYTGASGQPVGTWEVINGVFAFTQVNLGPGISATFQPNGGLIVKVFRHTISGELRTYLAKVLDGDGRLVP